MQLTDCERGKRKGVLAALQRETVGAVNGGRNGKTSREGDERLKKKTTMAAM